MAEQFTDVQRQEAADLASELNRLIGANKVYDEAKEINFVAIGEKLASIRTARYWLTFGFKSFTQFMKSLEGRTQNYQCLGVVRDLLPHVSKSELSDMGITKAKELRLLVKGGKSITAEIIKLAIDGTADELEARVATELGLVEDEPGDWLAFGGAKFSEEEKAEFLRTVNCAIKAADLESEEITEWKGVPSGKKKQILSVIFAEFLSSYGDA